MTFPIRDLENADDSRELDQEMVLPDEEVGRCMTGRDGASWIRPFQCKLCHYRDVQLRDPSPKSTLDANFIIFARRANLDAM